LKGGRKIPVRRILAISYIILFSADIIGSSGMDAGSYGCRVSIVTDSKMAEEGYVGKFSFYRRVPARL
jgi:hypothetical protein